MNIPRAAVLEAGALDHTRLPDKDGKPVKNDLEHPQSALLTESARPHLKRRHPDGRFWIGEDCGIYWRKPRRGEPPLRCAVAPDWYLVEGIDPRPAKGGYRRSYVMWQEQVIPLFAAEYVSGDGSEERDRTPEVGKFWVYEQAVRIPFYAIYEVDEASIEVYRLVRGRYRRQRPNRRGHFPIAPLGLELGVWQGRFRDRELPWLRWFDDAGQLLMNNEERAEQERLRAERLAERLRALGLDPDA